MADDPDDPWCYFGVWSAAGIVKVSDLLDSLGVRFEMNECVETEEVLREWCAWDESLANPHTAFNVWVHEDDLPKLGDKIVVMFPERKFGARLDSYTETVLMTLTTSRSSSGSGSGTAIAPQRRFGLGFRGAGTGASGSPRVGGGSLLGSATA